MYLRGREGARVRGGGKASQVVLEQSTSGNVVDQSRHRSCHIIKLSTNIKAHALIFCC